MGAFQAAFAPSKLRRGLSLLLHLAAAACALAYFGGLLRIALLIWLAAAAYWSWRESPRRVRTLAVDPQGRAALDTEAQRLATLAAAGVRVPQLLARNADALMFSHLGDTDILDAIKIAADPVACWQRGLDAIAAVHQRNQYLSQAFGRNIIACDDGETGFIDFEDDPGRYLPLVHCQSRDYLCYLQSSAFWLRENGLLPAAAAVWRRHRALPAAAAVGKTVRPILWMRHLHHPRWGSDTLRLAALAELVFLAGR